MKTVCMEIISSNPKTVSMVIEILMSHNATNPSNDIHSTSVNIPTKQNSQIIVYCVITSAIVPIALDASISKTKVIIFSTNNILPKNDSKK